VALSGKAGRHAWHCVTTLAVCGRSDGAAHKHCFSDADCGFCMLTGLYCVLLVVGCTTELICAMLYPALPQICHPDASQHPARCKGASV
jgi:Na+-translocating ferredoxin:NAD+ oxidoreductase RnfE subunit